MKTVLITGARGFVGRHLALSLHNQGKQVLGIGHGAWTETERAVWGVTHWLNGDVTKRNLDIIQSSMGEPDAVFHLAGGSSVGPSLLAPEEDFRRSVLSSAELLEWARVAAPEVRLVFSSSAAVYGAGHGRPISETDALVPHSPYGYHKRMSEELFESYGKNFGLKVASVRFFSLYGAELRKQLLWDVCCRLKNDPKHLVLGGWGSEMRDWLNISDAVKLLCIAADHAGEEPFIINGGSGIAVTVREIAQHLCAEWGMGTQLDFSGICRHGDPQYLVANNAHATSVGFKADINWQSGVRSYVEWFKRVNLQGAP